ncbi:MAG TPA: biopolymer transporter ExbD [Methylomirabilota bacterium]|nr:biopolymer transporter ExbD [Methylomirabilota bacterium]
MTPLIDVSLVLVVILMVATPMAFQSGIAVQSAARSGKKAAEHAKPDRIEVAVRQDGRVDVNRRSVPRDSLAVALRPLLQLSPNRLVILRCDDGVPHGTFVGVLDEARQLGAAKIAVVGS